MGDLTVPPWVFVSNTGRKSDNGDKADTPEDFLQHYLVTTWAPPRDWTLPPPNFKGVREATEIEKLLHKDLPQGLTFGCSNSNYP